MPRAPARISKRDRMFGLLLAIPFLLAGAYPIAIGLHWVPIDPAKVHAPGWVLVVCGLVFLGAGLAIVAMVLRPSSNPMMFVSIVIVLGITVVTHWVAFGGGERNFTHSRSTHVMRVELDPVDETRGRRMFGIGAVMLDIGILAVAALRIRKRRLRP